MSRILIWDLPTRIFHGAFAFSLTAAMAIGFLTDDDSPLFQLHMLFGIVALFLIAIRVVMGFAGSRHARFSDYPLRPSEVFGYFRSAIVSKTRRYAGNNPGSALAAVLMFLLVPLLFASGIGLGGGEVEEIHETLAWALLAVVSLHVAGIIWHTIRHRENIGLSMIHGRKQGEPETGIQSSHPWGGVAVLVATCAWVLALFSNHDPRAGTVKLPVLGTIVKLGESEHGESAHENTHREKRHRSDDD
jgi:cytochrome b